MTSTRSHLNQPHPAPSRQPPYALLFALFLSLSIVIFLLYQKYQKEYSTALIYDHTASLPTSFPDPTTIPQKESLPTSSSSAPTGVDEVDTPAPTVTPAPTPIFTLYTNDDDNFQVTYKSNRKLYEEKAGVGNRHVFYSPVGNITVHVGVDWSWLHPGREFSDSYLVDGQPTFVYSITSQKLIDFQKGDLDFTIQCVHGGNQTTIAECDQFVKDFKFLK